MSECKHLTKRYDLRTATICDDCGDNLDVTESRKLRALVAELKEYEASYIGLRQMCGLFSEDDSVANYIDHLLGRAERAEAQLEQAEAECERLREEHAVEHRQLSAVKNDLSLWECPDCARLSMEGHVCYYCGYDRSDPPEQGEVG